ncbi:MAG TPA: cadherin-like domain-containing protein [Thermoanaerobaculia bacterium]|nr:cadherin-like domain-containing protein [Thermoanaerobaculia bacterium]
MRLRPRIAAALALVALTTPLFAINIQIEGPQDSLAGAPTINHCTLRKAVINANTDSAPYPQCQAGSGADLIEFYFSGLITFALAGGSEDAALTGDLDITSDITIVGHPDGTIIDAADLDRVFDVHPGGTLTLQNIHVRNGTGLGGGGGIRVNGGTLHLDGVTISASHASGGDGGGLLATSATTTIHNSTISNNTAAHHAGAIYIEGGTAAITSSTIAGNGSSFSNLTGGIRNAGITTLRNTIVGSNSGNDIPNLDGTFVSLGYNLIGELGFAVGNPTIVPSIGDQIDVGLGVIALGPLQNNGGPTPTRALQAGSGARDKGESGGSTVDQRGMTRPCDDAGITNAPGGDGSDVGAFEEQVLCAMGGNTAPDAVNDNASVAEDSGANVVNLLTNDTDGEGDTLTITAVTQGAHGSVTFGPASVSYTPNADYFGGDSFTYTIDDGHSATDTATVSVTVTNVQDAPNAVNDLANVSEDSGPNVINVLTNDTDADGDSLSVTGATSGAHGTVTFNASSVSYTPHANYFGNDSFTYSIGDGHGGSDSATVYVTVSNVNDPPVATADGYAMSQDTVLNIPAPGVLGNDSDIDGDSLTATLVTNVSNGTLALNANGSFTYTPNPGYAGIDSFTYTAHDASSGSNAATVTIQIADTQPPTINASLATPTLWSPNNKMVDVGLTVSASDNSGTATTSVTVYSDEDDGATLDASGMLLLRAERAGTGDGRFYLIRVTATDPYGNTSTTCLTVTVPKSSSAADVASVTAQAAAGQSQCMGAGLFVVGS